MAGVSTEPKTKERADDPSKSARTLSAKSRKSKPRATRDRLNCRIDARIKSRAEEAALVLGQDLTAFTEIALNEKALEVLEREERILLSERDFQRFIDTLNQPKPPTPQLIAARRAYQRLQVDHPENNL